MSNIYGATSLLGGGSGALDKIDGTDLLDGDSCEVVTSLGVYHYHLDATSGATESSPYVVSPDSNAGDKRWVLVNPFSMKNKIYLTGDVTNNNASADTLEDVTGLSFAVVSGTIYRFHTVILVTSAAGTNGSRWLMNGPTTTILAYTIRYPKTYNTIEFFNTTDYTNPLTSYTDIQTPGIVEITGIVKPSANGTMQVRFASEGSSTATTAKEGSMIEYW